MKSYEEISGEVNMREVRLNVDRFRSQMAFDIHGLSRDSTHFMGLKWKTYYDEIAQRMILELQAKVASRKFATKTVRFPDGAWQAIRHAVYSSGWMRYQCVRAHFTKHPVRYVEVTMEANAYHPDIALPDHDTFVDIAMAVRRNGKY